MKNERFEKIYKKSIKLYGLFFKHDFKDENYIMNWYINKKDNKVSIKEINYSILSSEIVNVENYSFKIYKFQIKHLTPIELEENYNVLPQKEIFLYECGLSMSYIDEEGEFFEISGIFELCDKGINVVNERYAYLKKLVESKDIDMILSEIELYIDNKINDIENMLN
ncbi:MAG: hypothetical protein IJN90_04710 [Bacilli bacterium]|nr:hypothetical protein [Bacilli bacterium]